MEPKDLEPITQMVKLILDNGIMLVICAVVLIFGTAIGWTVVSMLRKYGPKVFESHIAMVTTVTTTQTTLADSVEAIAEHTRKNTGLNERQAESSEATAKTLELMREVDSKHLTEHQKTHKMLALLAEAKRDPEKAQEKLDELIRLVKQE